MKCPYCGNDLRPSRKEEDYVVCDTCKKKFRKEKFEIKRKEQSSRKNNPIIWVVTSVLLIFVVAIGLFYLISNKSEKISDLSGTWRSQENNGSYQEAVISDGEIVINWVSDNGDTVSLYWVGTYEKPDKNTNNYTWISKADVERTEFALLASQDAEKEFVYENGVISYETSFMGTTAKMKLEKID